MSALPTNSVRTDLAPARTGGNTAASAITTAAVTILRNLPAANSPIGLIAGGGGLPMLIAKNLRSAGHPVHGLGLAGQFDNDLPNLCSTFREIGVLRLGSWGKTLSRMGVHHAIMVGKVDKAKLMYDPMRIIKHPPDVATLKAWYSTLRKDRRSHALLRVVADELDRWGVQLLDSTAPIPDEMSTLGVMTQTQPSPEQRGDIDFAWPTMSHLLRLDIGQSIAVRDRDIIAVEAIEGTDRMIERAGRLCRLKGWTLCKAARLGHDKRSDVPTVGVNTIRTLHAAGAGCLALAAGEVIMLEKDEMIRLADKFGIAIVGIEPPHDGQHELALAADTIAELKLPAAPRGKSS
ncbi:MAG TPA: UDP-2,3-diacylglucosamine diphosphatase LpxI [Phycisphaerales bacterium]|nr:UDP-2,3-diacylglucosamine diphosphatase LpxI [Phycisphaerales bacterium]